MVFTYFIKLCTSEKFRRDREERKERGGMVRGLKGDVAGALEVNCNLLLTLAQSGLATIQCTQPIKLPGKAC